MNILVIDVGTSSMRGILYNEHGEKIYCRQVRYTPVYGDGGKVVQPVKDFEDALLLIARSVGSREELFGGQIEALSITSQRSSVIPVDIDGEPLMDAIMWQDTRNREVCKKLERYNLEIVERSGAKINTVFSGGKMRWIREERADIYPEIHKMLNIPEYLLHMMTGEYVSDYSYASRTNLFNIRTRSWDEELLKIFNVKPEHLCKLVPPGSICGKISGEFSRETGLKEGTPVISAGGDQQCAAIGYGAFKEGVVSIVTGTGAFLVTTSDQIPENLSENIICNCASVNDKYIIEANVLTCSSAFDWYCNTFYDWETIDYAAINRELAKQYNTESECIVLPYFQGRSTPEWNPKATACFTNITLATKRSEILKAVLEAVFLEISNNIENLKKYTDIHSAYISGGLTGSNIMNQMQADIYGIPLFHLEDAESASIGALMITAVTLGVYDSMESAFEGVCQTEDICRYDVQEEKHNIYVIKRKKMNELYKKVYSN